MTLRNTMLSAAIVTTGILSSFETATAVDTTASVTINPSPNSLTKNADMDFGDVTPATTQGCTIQMDTGGIRSIVFGYCLLGVAPSTAAEFTVTGLEGTTYSVSLPPDATLDGPGGPMLMTGFTHDALGDLTTGTETFRVGADLEINASQASGTYTGTFDVDVIYN